MYDSHILSMEVSLMSEECKLIGVCLTLIQQEDRFFFIEALNRHAIENGYRLVVFNSRNDFAERGVSCDLDEAAIYKMIPYRKLTALVMLSGFLGKDYIRSEIITNARRAGVPVFSIDADIDGTIPFFFDYSDIFEKISRHVIEHHKVKYVFMLGGRQGDDFSEQRVNSFLKVARENGLAEDKIVVGYGDFWQEPAIAQMEKWLDEEKRPLPEAIVCANDSMAIAVSTFLQNRGYRIPDDCIITGFDGIIQSDYHTPKLTTCKEDYDSMGRTLVEAAECVRNGIPLEDDYHVGFITRIRESCGCEKADSRSVNSNSAQLLSQLMQSFVRQDNICEAQNVVSGTKELDVLAKKMTEIFVFYSCLIALNDDMFEAPHFGSGHLIDNAYSDNMKIISDRYGWVWQETGTIRTEDFVPDIKRYFQSENPIIVMPVHRAELILGYAVIQPDMQIDEYQKVHAFASAASSALAMYHDRMQIESINLQLVNANRELDRLYVHDSLTGLYNRRGFYREFKDMLARNRFTRGMDVVMISADMDGLKHINDNYGHNEGDSAISTFANALLKSAIGGEFCARFGGDEFEVCGLVDSDEVSDYETAFRDRMRDTLEMYNQHSGKEYLVEASIGFSSAPVGKCSDYDELVRLADAQMYADKVSRKKQRI